jgi:hypothetical protein
VGPSEKTEGIQGYGMAFAFQPIFLFFWVKQVKKTEKIRVITVITRMLKLQIVCGAKKIKAVLWTSSCQLGQTDAGKRQKSF